MAKIKLPKQLKIASHTYKVLYPYEFKEINKVMGQCDSNKLEIRISQGEDTVVWQTFFHELFHAIDRITGQCRFEKEDEGESYLEGFTETFTQVFLDNNLLKKPT